MRQIISQQMKSGEIDISTIILDTKSRDDIPQILRGLQHIYTTPKLRDEVFEILKEILPKREVNGVMVPVDTSKGRPGMEQWKILVLGTLRLGLNTDYDRLQELANQHNTIRQMLGHSDWNDKYHYKLQTLKDNLRLFTPEILDKINQKVVLEGHKLLKKNNEEPLNSRADSFVVETNVHYPTDTNLLLDAIFKIIRICMGLSFINGWTEWRQGAYIKRQFKKAYRYVQRTKHSSSKDKSKRKAQSEVIKDAHKSYINQALTCLNRAYNTRLKLLESKISNDKLAELDDYMTHAYRQIDQIQRRVILGEKIPHEEKIFSVFQPHTEWISKGKAGVPMELGLRVCVVEDHYRFIMHHQVMERTTDEAIAVELVNATKERFPNLESISFDKGFHSKTNQVTLGKLLNHVILPKKGKLSAIDKEREGDPEFIQQRGKHSAVESAINALEVHGLDRCNDSGIDGFKRYVAMAVLARNIQRLGAVLRDRDRKRIRGPYLKAA